MRRIKIFLILFSVLLFIGCSSHIFDEASEQAIYSFGRQAYAFGSIPFAATKYYTVNAEWPQDIDELKEFAAASRILLDLEQYEKVELEVKNDNRLIINMYPVFKRNSPAEVPPSGPIRISVRSKTIVGGEYSYEISSVLE